MKYTHNENIRKHLKNIIQNNKLSNAYIFYGPRGIGKKAIALDSTLKNSYEIVGFTGPFTIHRMKAASVEISSTIPMILIKPSRILNLPIMRRLPQTPKTRMFAAVLLIPIESN